MCNGMLLLEIWKIIIFKIKIKKASIKKRKEKLGKIQVIGMIKINIKLNLHNYII